MSADGCKFVRQVKRKGSKVEDEVDYCGKIKGEGDDTYCPHHRLLMNDFENERRERARKRQVAKDQKKLLADSLKDSPLKAYNPAFEEERRTGYER